MEALRRRIFFPMAHKLRRTSKVRRSCSRIEDSPMRDVWELQSVSERVTPGFPYGISIGVLLFFSGN
jgi:hypothetical protein